MRWKPRLVSLSIIKRVRYRSKSVARWYMVNSALSLRKHALGRKLRELLMLVIQAVVYKEPLSKNKNETLTIQKLDLSRSHVISEWNWCPRKTHTGLTLAFHRPDAHRFIKATNANSLILSLVQLLTNPVSLLKCICYQLFNYYPMSNGASSKGVDTQYMSGPKSRRLPSI